MLDSPLLYQPPSYVTPMNRLNLYTLQTFFHVAARNPGVAQLDLQGDKTMPIMVKNKDYKSFNDKSLTCICSV